jgi:pimeloyl-ACP methyl ester carboxylesterase
MKLKRFFSLAALILLITLPGILLPANDAQPVTGTVKSADGITIRYDVWGTDTENPTLVFVHCWCCDRTYWEKQVPYFSKYYKVVTLDLAGHGESGTGRNKYTLDAFAGDVAAVVEKLDLKKIILLGHSMGGPVIAYTAPLLPGRVAGLVAVDTFLNIEQKFTKEQLEMFIAPLRKDFVQGTKGFIRMFSFTPETDPELIDKILNDMSSAPAEVGLSAMEEMFNSDISAALDKVKVPVYCVNADKFPTNVEAGKRHTVSFNVKTLPKTGHFLMLEKPDDFNKLLHETLKELVPEK